MSVCKYPGCGIELEHRPYSRKRDGIPSASTVASLLDDNKSRSFGWAASLIAATTAVHHADQWTGLVGVMSERAVKNGHVEECTCEKDGLCKACTYLRSEFDRQWTAKADRGTHIHHLALSWAKGEAVDVDADSDPYMDALEAFYKRHSPEWVELERTVLYDNPKSHAYRGQFDGIADLDCPLEGHGRCRWLVDLKSGGFWPAEQTLQLAGYRGAQHITTWADGKETIEKKMVPVAHAGVILLDPEYEGRLVELPANGDAHGTFLRLVDAYRFSRTMKEWEKAHPIGAADNDKEQAA